MVKPNDRLKKIKEEIEKLKLNTPKKDHKEYKLEKTYKWYSINKYVHYWREFWHPASIVKIRMETVVGDVTEFYVTEKDHGFYWRGGFYYLDVLSSYYIASIKRHGYDFHENYALPLKREIPIQEINKVIAESPAFQGLKYGLQPKTMKAFMISTLGEQLMKSGKWIKLLQTMFIILVVFFITFIVYVILFAWKTGMLEQAKNLSF